MGESTECLKAMEQLFLLEVLVEEVILSMSQEDDPNAPALGFGSVNPPVRYDTTGALSPAYGGKAPYQGYIGHNPPVRYDTTGALSAAHQHPAVRYDNTGALSPAYQNNMLPAMQQFPTPESANITASPAPLVPATNQASIAGTYGGEPTSLLVVVNFIDFSPLKIEEADFVKPDGAEGFNSGKSCLFPMDPDELLYNVQKDPMMVTVYKKPEKTMPVPAMLGKAEVYFDDEIIETIRRAASPVPGMPMYFCQHDAYMLKDLRNKQSGFIKLFVRLSCFGQSIVTQFQLAGTPNKSYLFKNSKADSDFGCRPTMEADFPPVCKRAPPRAIDEAYMTTEDDVYSASVCTCTLEKIATGVPEAGDSGTQGYPCTACFLPDSAGGGEKGKELPSAPGAPPHGYQNLHPPVRYDTTGALSPAFEGKVPVGGLALAHPAVRYDTTSSLSAAFGHPPVRYDTTSALSPAHQLYNWLSEVTQVDVEAGSDPELVAKRKSTRPQGTAKSRSSDQLAPGDKQKRKREKRAKPVKKIAKKKVPRPKIKFECLYASHYPSMRARHDKVCLIPEMLVPHKKGWLYNADPSVKPRPNWRPGAVTTLVSKLIEYQRGHMVAQTGPRALRLKKAQGESGANEGEQPLLHIHRKDGAYYISIHPMNLLPDEFNVPLQFKIPSDKRPEGVERGSDESSSSTYSDIEIDLVPPGAITPMEKEMEFRNIQTQYLLEDINKKGVAISTGGKSSKGKKSKSSKDKKGGKKKKGKK